MQQNYQNFHDETEQPQQGYPTGIPVGQPVQMQNYPPQSPHQQAYPQMVPSHPVQMVPPPPPPPVVIASAVSYDYPGQFQCSCCKQNVTTVVTQQNGNTTYLWCVAIGCLISPLCCCLPFAMDSCLDKVHYCPNCGHNIMRKHQKCFEFVGC